MSFDGRLTPLSINAFSKLMNNEGLRINPIAESWQGTWTPTNYTIGTMVNNVLRALTESLPNFYNLAVATTLNVSTYRNLLSIGRPLNNPTDTRINCPALGNSRPDTFKTSYAGYGTWVTGTVDEFGNITTGATPNMASGEYPPRDYPKSDTYSIIAIDYGSTSPGTYTQPWQWDHPYGWLTAWPARSTFQENTDDYAAAYFPRPDLRVRDVDLIEYDEYFKNGFVGTIARQSYYEFWSNYQSRRVNQYPEFINSFEQYYQYRTTVNTDIASFAKSKKFLRGNFSNINDLTTSDIAGVSLSFKIFGNDLIRLGKSIDLQYISKFGMPSILLLTLYKFGAITNPLKLALLYNDLNIEDITGVLTAGYKPCLDDEKKIYSAFQNIRGADLVDIQIILNCTTNGLNTLADLLNPLKMFPNSYQSLTIPQYRTDTAASKIYDFIYIGTGINSRIENWGSYLNGILPTDLEIACGAFMMTMCQIRNINQMQIESFAQVVSNLEVTNKDFPAINSADSVPVNVEAMDEALEIVALGGGNSGSFRMIDFIGAMSGIPYNKLFEQANNLIKQMDTVNLDNVYVKLKQKSLGNGWALVSRGKGWEDDVINPSPFVWAPSYAYTIFRTQELHQSATTTVTSQDDLTGIYIAATKIAFVSAPAPTEIYTVDSSSYNSTTNITTITLTSGLTVPVPAGNFLYIEETTYNSPVQDLIDAANIEILRLTTVYADVTKELNNYWDQIGHQLFIEQRSIPLAIPLTGNVYLNIDRELIMKTFCVNVTRYAPETEYGGAAPVLEAICDLEVIGGQSIVAAMREHRNALRLVNTGGYLDNGIPNQIDTHCGSAAAVINDGKVTSIIVTSRGSNYDPANPPKVIIGPQGGVFGGSGSGATAFAVIDPATKFIKEIQVTTPGQGYQSTPIVSVECPPTPNRLGDSNVPGSLAGSQFTGQLPVPDNLATDDDASLDIEAAIEDVIICNCDCWTL